MKYLHVVYCLTASSGDLYEAMTRVSLATLRLTKPSARVSIPCDQQTHQALQASGSQLFHEADAVRGYSFTAIDTEIRKPLIQWHDHCAMEVDDLG
jgi:hypothetical protein